MVEIASTKSISAQECLRFSPKSVTESLTPEACDYSNLSLPQTNSCPRLGLTDILRDTFPREISNSGSSLFPYDYDYPSYSTITVQARNQVSFPARDINLYEYPLKDMPDPHDQSLGAIVDVSTPTDSISYLTRMLTAYYIDCWTMTSMTGMTRFRLGFVGKWSEWFDAYAGQVQPGEPLLWWKQPFVSSFCSEPGVDNEISGSMTFNFAQTSEIPLYRVILDDRHLSMVLKGRRLGFINTSDLNITPNTPLQLRLFSIPSRVLLCV